MQVQRIGTGIIREPELPQAMILFFLFKEIAMLKPEITK